MEVLGRYTGTSKKFLLVEWCYCITAAYSALAYCYISHLCLRAIERAVRIWLLYSITEKLTFAHNKEVQVLLKTKILLSHKKKLKKKNALTCPDQTIGLILL